MRLGKVTGTVVCTRKHPSVENCKMLLMQPLDDQLKNVGGEIVALDAAQAGVGDLIYYVMSRESTLALEVSFAPVDAVITGIVDAVNSEKTPITNAKKIFVKAGKK